MGKKSILIDYQEVDNVTGAVKRNKKLDRLAESYGKAPESMTKATGEAYKALKIQTNASKTMISSMSSLHDKIADAIKAIADTKKSDDIKGASGL